VIPAAPLALIAGAIAGYGRLPSWSELPAGVAVRAAGVAFGFPLLPALAMRRVDSLHGGVVFAVLPLLTAAAMAALAGERPSGRFWL
jgi:hypothetical protein